MARIQARLGWLASGHLALALCTGGVLPRVHAQSPAPPRLHLRGQVIDSTGRAIPGVSMAVVGTDRGATSDSAGRFAIDSIQEGVVSVLFRHPHFTPMTVSLPIALGDTAPVPVMLLAVDDRPAVGVAPAMVYGRVTDQSGFPVAGADIMLATTGATATSDSAGRFVFGNLPPSRHLLRVRKIGYFAQYLSVTSTSAGAVRARIAMEPMGATLKEVVVRADRVIPRLKRFYERKASNGFGQFVSRDEFEERGYTSLSDLLGHMRGVSIGADAMGRAIPVTRMTCPMRVLLDGQPLELDGVSLTALVGLRDLAGVEVYRDKFDVPIEYTFGRASTVACGLVALWTR